MTFEVDDDLIHDYVHAPLFRNKFKIRLVRLLHKVKTSLVNVLLPRTPTFPTMAFTSLGLCYRTYPVTARNETVRV